jgi:hypothetical protein
MGELTLVPPAERSVLFVCPAWRRVELARICLGQLAQLVEELRGRGMRADAIVLADDENLDVADKLRFRLLEHDNRLGAKLNTGYAYAAEHGYEYVCPAATDTWLHPDRFTWLPGDNSILCTRNYTCLRADGQAQARLRLEYEGGVGHRLIPTRLLEPCNYRPLQDDQMSGCDSGTLTAIHQGRDRALHLLYTDLHPYEVVGFQSETQVTPFELLVANHLRELEKPFTGLANRYPGTLVDAIRGFYAA